MKLDKLELSALLGMQARHRELSFMMGQVQSQIEQLNEESKELFSDIEIRLKMEPDTIQNYDVDIQTGELLSKDNSQENDEPEEFGKLNGNAHASRVGAVGGHRVSDITELEDVD